MVMVGDSMSVRMDNNHGATALGEQLTTKLHAILNCPATTLASVVMGQVHEEATEIQFNNPSGLTIGHDDSVVVSDTFNHRICRISPQGLVTILAGTGQKGNRDGEGIAAEFKYPDALAVDGQGNVLVADTMNHKIRKVSPEGAVSTLAGCGEEGLRDGEGAAAQFNEPSGLTVDRCGNIYVADACNHSVRKISPEGRVSTLAGCAEAGCQDGQGAAAKFNEPSGIAVDSGGNIFVADAMNHRIRRISQRGTVSTFAGSGEEGYEDGEGTSAQFKCPTGIAVDDSDVLFVVDKGNQCIRRISPEGSVSTVSCTDPDGETFSFRYPCGVAVDAGGTVIVSTSPSNCLYIVSRGGSVSVLAGGAEHASTPSRGVPNERVSDEAEELIVVDTDTNCIQRISRQSVGSSHSAFSSCPMQRTTPCPSGEATPFTKSRSVSRNSTMPLHLQEDVCFVVEQQHVFADRAVLCAKCKHFRFLLDGQGGDCPAVHIQGTTVVAFEALLHYLHTDRMGADDEVLVDLARLCAQYQVQDLHDHCVGRLMEGITHENAVMWLVQAYTCEDNDMWFLLQGAIVTYVVSHLKEIWMDAKPTLDYLDAHHPTLYKLVLEQRFLLELQP